MTFPPLMVPVKATGRRDEETVALRSCCSDERRATMRTRCPVTLGLAVLLSGLPGRAWPADPTAVEPTAVEPADAHAQTFRGEPFPSAERCRTCHPDHYREWSVSQHAYAQVSPVFNAMQATITKLTNGTNGDFCIRCHTPIGMHLGESSFVANLERAPVAREGVTCVVCHRTADGYGKVSGRQGLVAGDLFTPVHGPTGNEGLRQVLQDPARFRVVTDPAQPGRAIHTDVVPFFQLTEPSFCGSCHDVNLVNGFRLEEAFSEFKSSPAAQRGETCQDCHMGTEPGVASGYAEGPAAIVGDVPARVRKRTNHMFPGPDHSVVHPAVFPHSPEIQAFATLDDWLTFDWEKNWGTDDFEATLDDAHGFPERWADAEDRYDARELLDRQIELLERAAAARTAILRRGYVLGDIDARRDRRGLAVRVEVGSGTDGHNVPTGFTAERVVWLQIDVTDAAGTVLFRSGDLDGDGDLRDSHSYLVRTGQVPRDEQLFSLQSRFLTRSLHGGEREQILAVNASLDPLPFVRPEIRSTVLLGRPLDARIHKMGIEPGGVRAARYRVAADQLSGVPPYRVDVRLVAAMVPVNLVREIQDVGFDWGLSARTIARRIVAGHVVLWRRTVMVAASTGAEGSDG